MVRFLPKDDSCFDELETLARHLTPAGDLLHRSFQNHADPAVLAGRIRREEHDADELTHGITTRLDGSIAAPFGKEDVYAIARGLDRVVDQVEEAGSYMAESELSRADPGVSERAGILLRSSVLVATAVSHLRNAEIDRVPFRDIQALSEEGDAVYERVMTKVFAGDPAPIEALQWKEMYGKLETAIDYVADVLERIAVTHR